MREETKEKNRRITDKTFVAVFDPTETYVVCRRQTPKSYFLNFAPLQNALARLQESAKKYDAALVIRALRWNKAHAANTTVA